MRKLFIFLVLLVLGGVGGYFWWMQGEFARVAGLGSATDRDAAIAALMATAMMAAVATLGTALVAWLTSFDDKRRRRPWEFLVPVLAAGGAPGGVVVRLYLFTEASGSEPVYDNLMWGLVGVCALIPVLVIFAFEVLNRIGWTRLALFFDRKEMATPALVANRAALLFKPGQEATLRSVAIARFRRGARGEVVGIIQTLYDAGIRDDDVLEALCKNAAEQGDHETHLRYLRELKAVHPEDEELNQILLDTLIEQRLYSEALKLVENYGLPADDDGKEQYAKLLLVEGHIEKACGVAIELGHQEGIPFRRSAVLLREILSRVSEYVPALNALATQAERMAQRDQRLRWLEKSLEANPAQPLVRRALLDIYRETANGAKLERLLQAEAREQSGDPEILLELASTQNENGKVEEARATLQRILARKGAPVRAYTLLARMMFEDDQLTEARRVAEEGIALQPSEQERRELESLLARVEKAVLTSEVATLLDKAKAEPDNLLLQMEALNKLIEGRHIDKVIGQVDVILSNHPPARDQVIDRLKLYAKTPDAPFPILNLLSDLLANAGRYDETIEVLQLMSSRAIDPVLTIRDNAQKILRRSPHHLGTLRMLGDTYRAHGKYTDMIHSYSLYLSHGGDETEEIDRSLANAYLALGDYDAARRFVQQLIAQERIEPVLLQRMVALGLDTNHPEDAVDYMKRLEVIDPKGVETIRLKEKVNLCIGERRFEFLKKELEAGKGGGEILEQLGDIARDMMNLSEAITNYQRASRDRDDPARARRCQAKLAWCYIKKRLDDLGAETLREISISLDDDPEELGNIMEILYEIGEMLLEFKSYSAAERIFKQLCKIDAGYRDVLQKVESLRG